MKFQEGQKVKVFWLCGCNASTPEGEVTKVRKSFVVVKFACRPRGGFDEEQKFTLRKNGEYIAAGWHWVSGVPGLRAI